MYATLSRAREAASGQIDGGAILGVEGPRRLGGGARLSARVGVRPSAR